MPTQAKDDFFGTSYIGLDPHDDILTSRLDQLSSLGSIISAQSQNTSSPTGTSSPQDVAIPRPNPPPGNPVGDQQRGNCTPDLWYNGRCNDHSYGCPGSQQWDGSKCRDFAPGEANVWPNQPPGTTPPIGSTPPGTTQPPGSGQPPPGSRNPPGVTTPGSGGSGSGGGSYGTGPTGTLPPDLINLRRLLSTFLSNNFSDFQTPYQGDLSVGTSASANVNKFLAPGFSSLDDIEQTGGVPDISKALDAIRTSSMGALDSKLADIREKYGMMGLGAGSDVSYSLAQGASQGIADMQKQQEELVAQVMQAGTQNRLEASKTRGLFGSLVEGAAASDQASEAGNIGRTYADYLRTTSPSPYLQAALSYATNFPPPQYPTANSGTALATAGITAGGSILGAIMPFLLAA